MASNKKKKKRKKSIDLLVTGCKNLTVIQMFIADHHLVNEKNTIIYSFTIEVNMREGPKGKTYSIPWKLQLNMVSF